MLHFDSGRNVNERAAAKHGGIQSTEFVIPDRNHLAEPFPENFRMIFQSLGRPDKNDTLFANRFLNVRINRFAIELRFDAGQELTFLFWNAEALKRALYIVRHIFPVSFRLNTATEVVTDLIEIDRLKIFARPMRRQWFLQECLETLQPKFANPVGIFLDVRDVVNGFL